MGQRVGNISNSVLHGVNVSNSNIDRDKKGHPHSHRGIYLILVITNLVSILAILIHFVDVNTISNDSYIGVVASLMGMCATFIVGFQIYNSIEYKSEIQSLQNIQEKYEKDLKGMEDRLIYESNEAYIGIYIVQGLTFKDKSLPASLNSFLKSIIHSLNVGDFKRSNVAIRHVVTLAADKGAFVKALQDTQIKAVIRELRMHLSYEYVEDQLEPLFSIC